VNGYAKGYEKVKMEYLDDALLHDHDAKFAAVLDHISATQNIDEIRTPK